MKVTFRDSSEAVVLTGFYNEQIASIPYCSAVTPEEFELGFNFRVNPWPEEDNVGKELAGHSERRLVVAELNGEIVGFADLGKQAGDGKIDVGLIRALMYRPGCRSAGQAVLEGAERYFRDLGLDAAEAFIGGNYASFRYGSAALPQTMGHVQALFGMNGYRRARFDNDGTVMGWLFFHLPKYRVSEPSPPDPTAEIAVKHIPGRGGLPHLEVKALYRETPFAYCWSSSAESHCLNPDGRTTFYTDDVSVDEAHRGKGWGRYLMERTLWEMGKLGYRDATLSCSLPNHLGHLLYTNLGYRVVDSSAAFKKDIAA